MLQHEFEQQVGLKVSADYYNKVIEPFFRKFGGDQEEFCSMWAGNHEGLSQGLLNVILIDLEGVFQACDYATDSEKKLLAQMQEIDKLTGEIEDWKKAVKKKEVEITDLERECDKKEEDLKEIVITYLYEKSKDKNFQLTPLTRKWFQWALTWGYWSIKG